MKFKIKATTSDDKVICETTDTSAGWDVGVLWNSDLEVALGNLGVDVTEIMIVATRTDGAPTDDSTSATVDEDEDEDEDDDETSDDIAMMKDGTDEDRVEEGQQTVAP